MSDDWYVVAVTFIVSFCVLLLAILGYVFRAQVTVCWLAMMRLRVSVSLASERNDTEVRYLESSRQTLVPRATITAVSTVNAPEVRPRTVVSPHPTIDPNSAEHADDNNNSIDQEHRAAGRSSSPIPIFTAMPQVDGHTMATAVLHKGARDVLVQSQSISAQRVNGVRRQSPPTRATTSASANVYISQHPSMPVHQTPGNTAIASAPTGTTSPTAHHQAAVAPAPAMATSTSRVIYTTERSSPSPILSTTLGPSATTLGPSEPVRNIVPYSTYTGPTPRSGAVNNDDNAGAPIPSVHSSQRVPSTTATTRAGTSVTSSRAVNSICDKCELPFYSASGTSLLCKACRSNNQQQARPIPSTLRQHQHVPATAALLADSEEHDHTGHDGESQCLACHPELLESVLASLGSRTDEQSQFAQKAQSLVDQNQNVIGLSATDAHMPNAVVSRAAAGDGAVVAAMAIASAVPGVDTGAVPGSASHATNRMQSVSAAHDAVGHTWENESDTRMGSDADQDSALIVQNFC